MREHNGYPVSDLIDESCREQVYQKLDSEINGDQHGNSAQWDMIAFFKGQKQKWYKIIDDCLHNVADETGINRLLVIWFHNNYAPFLSQNI